ncbi:uncharacterized protein LOC126910461 [Daktulosphaira vitifoliae]|uniref:uncharacterized protein LOC126910461 n=1 Tax=Daktulosphaira vitifoliae TaxID=58002 RepID=UPI0021AA459B|nr:uncharacterized protein LOC126910461 [Daktulosphaira vitifoliae]
MNIELLTLIFFTKNVFFEVGLVNCFVDPTKYTLYFKQVTCHVCHQLKKLNLEHFSLLIEDDNVISIKDVIETDFNFIHDLTPLYYIVVNLINYLFAQVLEIFNEHLKIIVDVCEYSYENNLFENAIYCTVVLLNTTKNSNMMFEYLYESIRFIDYLDVKLGLSRSLRYPKTIIEEIYTVKNYIFLMKTSEMLNYVDNDGSIKTQEAKQDCNEINNFFNKVVAITNEIFIFDNTITNRSEKINFREEYYGEYITNMYQMNFVDFVREKLYGYCLKTIDNYYFKIGFDVLLNPNTAELIPPQNYNFIQNKSIKILNTLFHEGKWNLLNYIRIKVDEKTITVNRIVRDTVDNFNFNLKKKYFTQLIRCKYNELLKNYNTYMSAVIRSCRYENQNLNGLKDCIIRFLCEVKNSKEMFKYMLLALDKLKSASIWEVTRNSYACLKQTYDLLRNFFPDIEHLSLTSNDFSDLSPAEQKLKANDFLLNFQKARHKFNRVFIEGRFSINEFCLIDGEFLKKNDLLLSWKIMAMYDNTKNNITSPICLYEYALDQFRKFCQDAIKSEYDYLGFNKISD